MFHVPAMLFFFFVILPVAIVAGVIVLFTRMFRRRPAPEKREETVDETRMIQEIYEGLSRMERRIEALETILLEDRRETPGGRNA
ncbi:MAG: envelope stress response membrane protein PspB [Desulfovibrionaceae bacterium]